MLLMWQLTYFLIENKHFKKYLRNHIKLRDIEHMHNYLV